MSLIHITIKFVKVDVILSIYSFHKCFWIVHLKSVVPNLLHAVALMISVNNNTIVVNEILISKVF